MKNPIQAKPAWMGRPQVGCLGHPAWVTRHPQNVGIGRPPDQAGRTALSLCRLERLNRPGFVFLDFEHGVKLGDL